MAASDGNSLGRYCDCVFSEKRSCTVFIPFSRCVFDFLRVL